jgi:hypothetical protein
VDTNQRSTIEKARSTNRALLRERMGVPEREKQRLLQVKKDEKTL